MALQEGDQAPNVTLPCCDGEDFEEVELHSLLEEGNLLLAFFPLAFSSVCTDEMCTFSDHLNQLESLNTKVYGVSVDSPFALNEFIRKEGLNFSLLSDFNREAVGAFDVLEDELLGLESVARRSVFLIDQDGVIQYAWATEDASQQPDYDRLRTEVKNLS